jgi:Xaa-Pro aminopeptidase
MNQQRLKKLQMRLKHPLLIKNKENILYFIGHQTEFLEPAYLLVKRHSAIGFGSGLEKISWVKKSDSIKHLSNYVHGKQVVEFGKEFTYAEIAYLKSKNPQLKLRVLLKPGPVEVLRSIKEPSELMMIRKSMLITAAVFNRVKQELKNKSWTEAALARFIHHSGLKLGAEDVSFPVIVASGVHAAIPHHIPTAKKLRSGEPIVIDFGFKYKGYCGDFTRTVFLKTAPARFVSAYQQVKLAYQNSLAKVRVGVRASSLFDTAMQTLNEKKLGHYFIHNLGHGSGLEIHELPNLSADSRDVLQNGMVFSIEPGVYLPKIGGIRIEDLVYLQRGRARRFINVPIDFHRNLII